MDCDTDLCAQRVLLGGERWFRWMMLTCEKIVVDSFVIMSYEVGQM